MSVALDQNGKNLGALEAYGAALLPQHAALLADSAIAPEVAVARGYRSVTTKAELERCGFGPTQRQVPALLIPVHDVHGRQELHQLRPDAPRRDKHGKPIKYETPTRTTMLLDVPPAARDRLGDPHVPLFITEGVRKADAAVSAGLCCVALLGVWNFRGRNDKGGKVALADFEYIAWNGRRVYVVFDSDVMLKLEVHRALARVKDLLDRREAQVAPIYLPSAPDGSKVGLDDYFAAGNGVDELLTHASRELREAPGASELRPATCYVETDDGGLARWKNTPDGRVCEPLTNFTARIVADVVHDDGAEQRRMFTIEARLNGGARRIEVPASSFPALGWAGEALGAEAIIYPGNTVRDHARVAIQALSGRVPARQVFTHTGWRELEGSWHYLHGAGAIGPRGLVEEVEVELAPPLDRFALPAPVEGEELVAAVRASLEVLELAPDYVTVPLFTAVYRAVAGTADFALHVAGPTGAGKSELAALAQAHFGAGLDARHLPGSWSSTANALEGVAFIAKDALLVVDDFAPDGTAQDVSRLHRDADRLIRAQGNHSGRQRMRADTTLRAAKPPRGLILSTGEDVPRGQSLRARLLVLELGPSDVDWERLSEAQRAAGDGTYASALAAYVHWLAERYDELSAVRLERMSRLRDEAVSSPLHRRTVSIVAELASSLELFARFAVECGALAEQEAVELSERAWQALGEAADAQAEQQAAADPVHRFRDLLVAAIASGSAHVASAEGGAPENPGAWGWRPRAGGFPGVADWEPLGKCIGWLSEPDLYLEPEASFRAAETLARDTGSSLGVGSKTLHRRLRDRGVILISDSDARVTTRQTIMGQRRRVLHLSASYVGEPGQPGQPGQEYGAKRDSGPIAGPVDRLSERKPGHEPGHEPASLRGHGPIGPIGPIPPSQEELATIELAARHPDLAAPRAASTEAVASQSEAWQGGGGVAGVAKMQPRSSGAEA